MDPLKTGNSAGMVLRFPFFSSFRPSKADLVQMWRQLLPQTPYTFSQTCSLLFFRWVTAFQSLIDFSCGFQSFSQCNLDMVASILLFSIEWIADLSKLESIRFGSTTFWCTTRFYLSNLTNLRRITFGTRSFIEVTTMHFMSRSGREMACRFAQPGDHRVPAE